MNLSSLFIHCLHASYTHIQNSADFALERIDSTLYIYFASSEGVEDWRNNLDFPARAYRSDDQPIWFAHRGFLRVWESIIDYIATDLADSTVERFVITGYSHGAALAALCHEYVWRNRPDLRRQVEGYGFGCPRVIWGIPSACLKERWDRFTVIRNLDDIVTHLPPAFLGYTHVGKLLEIGQRGKYSGIDAHRPENILVELLAFEPSSSLNKHISIADRSNRLP